MITARVTATKTIARIRCTVIETKTIRDGHERVSKICYQASEEGIFVLQTTAGPRAIVLDPPRPLMMLPPAAGKTWTWRPKMRPVGVTVTDRWIAEETVRVPAGTFRAWKMESVTQRGDLTVRVFSWFAPGIGIVKIVRESGGSQESAGEGGSELVSYKIP